MSAYDYKAFITYSHDDSATALRLQRALESYRVPSRLVGQQRGQGRISKRAGKIFRDREELPAGARLSETLNRALARSEFLIVICSPAARSSRWVNLEIKQFKKTHGSDKVLCYIVDGEPYAGEDTATKHLECFPGALEYLKSDAAAAVAEEPIAADMRDTGDGKKLARLKIVSGLLGVGLDELVQRDTQRRYRSLMVISATSALGMIIMSALAFVAIDARNEEQERRAEAEDLIEFMLSDLRDRLDAVGRLDVLDSVGEKAIEYYSNVDLSEHTGPSLGRRARAFHLLGEVDDLKGDMQGARDAFEEAFQSTAELLARSPDDGERIYNHAQSVFWVGYLDWRLGNQTAAESAFREYIVLSSRLVEIDPDNPDWKAESGHSNINLGVYYYESGDAILAVEYFQNALTVFEELGDADQDSIDWLEMEAQSLAWLADAYEIAGDLQTSKGHRRRESVIHFSILEKDPDNQATYEALTISQNALADISISEGDLDLAISTLSKAGQLASRLMRRDPENMFYVYISSKLGHSLAEAMMYRGDLAEADGVLKQSRSQVAQLLSQDDEIVEWMVLDKKVQILEGRLSLARGEADEAVSSLVSAITELEEMVTINPEVSEFSQLLALTHANVGATYAALDDSTESLRHFKATVFLLESSSDTLPLRYLSVLGQAYQAINEPDKATSISNRLMSAGFNHPDRVHLLPD